MPVREALESSAVGEVATSDSIPHAVVEVPNAGSAHIELGGLLEDAVIGHFPEIPSFPINVDVGPVHAIAFQCEFGQFLAKADQHGFWMMPHQIKPEGIDLVLLRPKGDRIDDELFHHLVFSGGIETAGGCGHIAAYRIVAVVIARHNLIEHRGGAESGFVRVVVDDIHHHIQPDAMQRPYHVAKFFDPRRTIRLRAVTPFRDIEMNRIIAPIESVFAR